MSNRNEGRLPAAPAVWRSLLTRYPMNYDIQEMIRAILSFGCMTSSSVASPILFEFRMIWLADILIFFISSAAFMLQHSKEIKTYGPFTLVFATFLGVAAYSSARTPLKELVPWVPLASCLFLLLTGYFLPKLRRIMDGQDSQESMEEGRSDGYQRLPRGPGTFQFDEDGHPQDHSPERTQLMDHDVSNMDRPESRLSGRQSDHESDIDLNESAIPLRMVSQTRDGSLPNSLIQVISVDNHITRCVTCGRRHNTNQLGACSPRPLSPESLEVHLPSPASEESGRPSRG